MEAPLILPQAEPAPLTAPDGRRLGFGEAFTRSMAWATWSEAGWSHLEFSPRRPLLVDPAMVGMHYGQIVFEGLKAYALPDGAMAVFRPDAYARRMRHSARRFAMPEPPVDMFVSAVVGVASRDADCMPDDPAAALYLRPVLLATEPNLGLRPSRTYLLMVMAFVTGGFFSDVPDPIVVKVEREFVRAAPGGTGAAKCAGNYAPTYLAQLAAARDGCHQVVWLDSGERTRVEELGGMNLFFVHRAAGRTRITTPPLTDTILPGVTRDSLITLARDLGYQVDERPMAVHEWRDGCLTGEIVETFACGTAATVTPVGTVRDGAEHWVVGAGKPGPVTLQLRQALTDAWNGRTPGHEHWLHRVPVSVSAPDTMP